MICNNCEYIKKHSNSKDIIICQLDNCKYHRFTERSCIYFIRRCLEGDSIITDVKSKVKDISKVKDNIIKDNIIIDIMSTSCSISNRAT